MGAWKGRELAVSTPYVTYISGPVGGHFAPVLLALARYFWRLYRLLLASLDLYGHCMSLEEAWECRVACSKAKYGQGFQP